MEQTTSQYHSQRIDNCMQQEPTDVDRQYLQSPEKMVLVVADPKPVQEPAGLKEAESAQKDARSLHNKAWNEAAWPVFHPNENQQNQQEQLYNTARDGTGSHVYQAESSNDRYWARQPVQEPAGLKEAESAQKNARSLHNQAWNEASYPTYHPFENQQRQQEQLYNTARDGTGSNVYKAGSSDVRYWTDSREDNIPRFARQPVQEPAGLKEAESAQKNARSLHNKAWNEAAWPAYHPYEYQREQQEHSYYK